MNKPYNIQNTNICNGIFHISFFKALNKWGRNDPGKTGLWAKRLGFVIFGLRILITPLLSSTLLIFIGSYICVWILIINNNKCLCPWISVSIPSDIYRHVYEKQPTVCMRGSKFKNSSLLNFRGFIVFHATFNNISVISWRLNFRAELSLARD